MLNCNDCKPPFDVFTLPNLEIWLQFIKVANAIGEVLVKGSRGEDKDCCAKNTAL